MTYLPRFNNPGFLFVFLPATYAGYWLIPSRVWKLLAITVAGIVFYSFWDVRFAALMVAAAVVDFFVALAMDRSPHHRGRWLTASVIFNLGILVVFKYAMFAAANARSIFGLLGLPITIPYFTIVLPVGISFFTFKSMSYTIDVYRGEVPATRDFLKYLAFITLFADMVAGPIIRYRSLSDQLDRLPRRPSSATLFTGLTLLSIGLFKKVVLADSVAYYTEPLWAAPGALTFVSAWMAALGYTMQLYFDFSGYSDMAIGLGALLGFTIPQNFRAPYQALNPSDFWRRWHISLSSWLRDYLYISLGGNRVTEARAALNMMIVMLLGGLWHGAAWTFVLWGAYHGTLLIVYKYFGKEWDGLPKAAQHALMIFLVVIGWVIFRAPDLHVAGTVLGAMFGFAPMGRLATLKILALGLMVLFPFALLARPTADLAPAPTRRWALLMSGMFMIAVLRMSDVSSPFLYYQF